MLDILKNKEFKTHQSPKYYTYFQPFSQRMEWAFKWFACGPVAISSKPYISICDKLQYNFIFVVAYKSWLTLPSCYRFGTTEKTLLKEKRRTLICIIRLEYKFLPVTQNSWAVCFYIDVSKLMSFIPLIYTIYNIQSRFYWNFNVI